MSCVDLHKKTILVTGAAGFIGSNLVKRLYDDVKDVTVIGIALMETLLFLGIGLWMAKNLRYE